MYHSVLNMSSTHAGFPVDVDVLEDSVCDYFVHTESCFNERLSVLVCSNDEGPECVEDDSDIDEEGTCNR